MCPMCRTRIYGTHGELSADFAQGIIEVQRFGEDKQVIAVHSMDDGHGGGDFGLMRDFVRPLTLPFSPPILACSALRWRVCY